MTFPFKGDMATVTSGDWEEDSSMWLMSKCEDCESVERTEDGGVLKEASRGCTDVIRHGDASVNEGQGGRVDTGLEDAWMDELSVE